MASTLALNPEPNSRRFTPPISCGLLAGTWRAELLERGQLVERVLRPEDLSKAEAIFLINSVRGWMPVQIVRGS